MSTPETAPNTERIVRLRTRMVIEFDSGSDHARLERLCWIDPTGTYAVLIDMLDDDAWFPCYGPVWDKALSQLWLDTSTSLRELSLRLGVDPNTVKRQAVRLGLSTERPGSRNGKGPRVSLSPIAGPKRDIEEYKMRWLEQRGELPEGTRTQLREVLPDVYAVLRRYAAAWLDENSPQPLSKSNSVSRVDWEARDIDLAQKVSSAADTLRSLDPPVKLTPTAILREAGCIWADRRKSALLPKTWEIVNSLSEDRVGFAVRRIFAAARVVGPNMSEWRLVRKAGLRPDLLQNSEIRRRAEVGFEQPS